jgi:segregation and condensation protein B
MSTAQGGVDGASNSTGPSSGAGGNASGPPIRDANDDVESQLAGEVESGVGSVEAQAAGKLSAAQPVGKAPEAAAPGSAQELRGALEAILLVVDEPANQTMLAQVIGTPEPQVVLALHALQAEYEETERGFELREVAGGWRLYTRSSFADYVERFVLDGQQARLTQAALETLAVVAYRQPVSRTRVSAVRGVNVDGVMRTLVSRGLVEEAGSDHESGAILYCTSPYFLERLGLRDLTDLPSLANFLPESTTIDQLEDELSREG